MKLICPNCGEEIEHEILAFREEKTGVEYTLRCNNCGYTYKKFIKEEKMLSLKVIWSWQEESEVKKFSAFEEDILSVGDEITVSGINSIITAIDSHSKRVRSAAAKDIDTIWAKRFDSVVVKISINRGNRTTTHTLIANPHEEFYVGDLIEIDGIHAMIHKIKNVDKFINRGGEIARNIVRIYAKEIREPRRKH